MKKLLALVLCVMLFVSIVPTSAFADDPPKINLKPAVDQMNSLYTAYTKLAVGTGLNSLYDGYVGIANLFAEYLTDFNLGIDPNNRRSIARAIAIGNANFIAFFYNYAIQNVNSPMSPEGIFEGVGSELATAYDAVGQGVVDDCQTIERFKTAEIIKNVNEEYAKVAALMPAVPAQQDP